MAQFDTERLKKAVAQAVREGNTAAANDLLLYTKVQRHKRKQTLFLMNLLKLLMFYLLLERGLKAQLKH